MTGRNADERDAEDETNIYQHARRNAQEAISLAKQKAQDFDTQAALERKTNEALKLAKAQAHLRTEETVDDGATSANPLVDCKLHSTLRSIAD